MKKWHGIEELIDQETEIDNGLAEYKKIMQEIPNFNHEKYVNDKKVYENQEYIILKVKSKGKIGFIIHNTKKDFKHGHSHLNSRKVAETIISNVMHKKRPKTDNTYLLESHIRISDDDNYIRLIEELIEAKKSKSKVKYRNKNINSKKK